jgi:drug/metabolite transporter (DMT)-like permease
MKSIGWMLISCLMFATVMACIRFFMTGIPSEQSVFLRYIIGAILILPLVWRRVPELVSTPHWGKFVLRFVLHGLGVYTWFYSVLRLPLADVNALLNLGPIYASLGAVLLFGERLRFRRVMAILISCIGAMIVIKPGFATFNLGILAVLAAAPLFAFSDLIAKQLKAHHDDNLIIFALSVGIAALLLLPAALVWVPLSGKEWFGAILLSICATFGHVALMRAFRGPMWAAQSGKYVQLIFVVFYGILLFGEVPSLSTLIGAVIVCTAVTYIALRENRLKVKTPPVHPAA